ncbi:MAG: penicillin-binding protein 2 [Albidovulum sp.]|nr:penicillin-binding protein 2 [Albidovulum sp.]
MTYFQKLVNGYGHESDYDAAANYYRSAEDAPKGLVTLDANVRGGSQNTRLVLVALAFVILFCTAAAKMVVVSTSKSDKSSSTHAIPETLSDRADIVDRNGVLLATNLKVHSLYAHPEDFVDPDLAAKRLAEIFPDLDENTVYKKITTGKFAWLKRKISHAQVNEVKEIGEPGLYFGTREARVYPKRSLASHVLGGSAFGEEHVNTAEIVGIAGVEKYFDKRLRDQIDVPLELSLDLTAQWIIQNELQAGIDFFRANFGGAVLMDVHSGEIISLVSLPDFDPNRRSSYSLSEKDKPSLLFSHVTQGIFELGSVFKIFVAAQALELGLADTETKISNLPYKVARKVIRDKHQRTTGDLVTVRRALVRSANPVTARLAGKIGSERQKEFLGALGLLAPVQVELPEARVSKPMFPSERWTALSSVTIGYGHGISVTPLNLAAAYATLANGGYSIRPTILKQESARNLGRRIIARETSREVLSILRQVVKEGTATQANVGGYSVGGKTGTGNKPKVGGYAEDKVISTFASIFPTERPRYVLVVVLDEPEIDLYRETRRTAGWTAAPVAAAMIKRLAPILGIPPAIESVSAGI